jgi:hypothetical protein
MTAPCIPDFSTAKDKNDEESHGRPQVQTTFGRIVDVSAWTKFGNDIARPTLGDLAASGRKRCKESLHDQARRHSSDPKRKSLSRSVTNNSQQPETVLKNILTMTLRIAFYSRPRFAWGVGKLTCYA